MFVISGPKRLNQIGGKFLGNSWGLVKNVKTFLMCFKPGPGYSG